MFTNVYVGAVPLADPMGRGRQGRAPPPRGSIFFHFHTVFGKNYFAHFLCRKLHANERIWTPRRAHVHGAPSLDPPTQVMIHFLSSGMTCSCWPCMPMDLCNTISSAQKCVCVCVCHFDEIVTVYNVII